MDVNDIKSVVRSNVSKKRYAHTIRVYEEAVRLARHYKVNEEKVVIAALFHDYCKDEPVLLLKDKVVQYDLPVSLFQYDDELLHGPVAAKEVAYKYNISDKTIYNAIYYHTTGRPNMSLVEKVVFLADYIEPNRIFHGIDVVRDAAYRNMDEAIELALYSSIRFLENKGVTVHPLSIDAYEFYKNKEVIDS